MMFCPLFEDILKVN